MNSPKKILEKTEYYIEFSDEELSELGWEKGKTKLSYKYDKDTNSVTLTPYANVELDMSDWDRELLEYIITTSCEEDISCNQVIENVLTNTIKSMDASVKKKQELLCENNS